LPHLVAFDDVGGLHLIAALCVDLLIFDPMAGVLVDLMKADLLSLAGRGEKRDWARDEGQLQIAFPIGARGHDFYSGTERRNP
jgi:hypothetical protein